MCCLFFLFCHFPTGKIFSQKNIYKSLKEYNKFNQTTPSWLLLITSSFCVSQLFSILWWLFCSIPTVVAFKACKEFKLHPLKLPVEPPLTRAQQHGGRTDISSPQYSWTSCSISLWAPIKWVQGSPPVFETSLFVAYPLALVYRPLLLAYASKNTQVSLVLFFSSLLLIIILFIRVFSVLLAGVPCCSMFLVKKHSTSCRCFYKLFL